MTHRGTARWQRGADGQARWDHVGDGGRGSRCTTTGIGNCEGVARRYANNEICGTGGLGQIERGGRIGNNDCAGATCGGGWATWITHGDGRSVGNAASRCLGDI